MAPPGHTAAPMSPWGFGDHQVNGMLPSMPSRGPSGDIQTMTPAKDVLPSQMSSLGGTVSQQPNHSIEQWCNKHNLGLEECKGLIKLGFRVDKPEELEDLDEATWTSVGLGLLHQRRIKVACAAGN